MTDQEMNRIENALHKVIRRQLTDQFSNGIEFGKGVIAEDEDRAIDYPVTYCGPNDRFITTTMRVKLMEVT